MWRPFCAATTPTAIPANGYYDKATLATDVAALIRALGGNEPVHLVGQDWGAIVSYAVLAAFPQLVRRAVLMAVPHPAVVARSMLDPKHVQRSFHWWFFQLADPGGKGSGRPWWRPAWRGSSPGWRSTRRDAPTWP